MNAILGSDYILLLGARAQQKRGDGHKEMVVNTDVVIALIAYYEKLVANCSHDYDYSSPIDTGLCTKCGLLE